MAFIAELNSKRPDKTIVSTEHLDTKRKAFNTEYSQSFKNYLEVKYSNYLPDIIYLTDDNALSFALDNFPEIFPDIPVVFSGVNNYSIQDTLDSSQITGVFEKKDIARNLGLLNRIDPDAKDILVIGDNSNTYRAIETEIKLQLHKFSNINAIFIASHSIDELKKHIEKNSSKYLFLTTLGAVSDSTGEVLPLKETLAALAATGNNIIISMEDAYVLDGILGGYVTSGNLQGQTAATMVSKYLSGTAISSLPAVKESPNNYIFNFSVLKDADITLPQSILDQATLLNEPVSFYIKHRPVITGLIIILALILIVSLSIFLALVARKNKEIRSTSIQTKELEQIIIDRTKQLSDEKQKLTRAQEIAHIGNYTWQFTPDKTTWSDELYNITGQNRESFRPTYNNYVDCIHPDDREIFTQLTKKALKKKSRYSGEYRILRPDNEVRYVYEQGDLKIDEHGNLFGLVGVVHDITDRKTSENEYLRLQRELNQSRKMEALGQLTGGIAHDFNNILAIISGYSDLIQQNCRPALDEKLFRYLNNIDLATTRATDLVSKMMVFSRDDTGVNEALAFPPLIEDSITMLRSIIPSSIAITYYYDDDLPTIMMDKTQLHQIMMNLAINAKDAMNGIGKLDIRLEKSKHSRRECSACHKHVEGDWISLSVSDTGSGMHRDTVNRIFEPFFTTKSTGNGTGMGLSVLSAIVESHGGHILIETKVGAGTTFKLLFPAAPAVEQIPGENQSRVTTSAASGHGQKILIVDDEPALTEMLSELLGDNGYQCTTLNNSPDALSLIEKDNDDFELLITDQTMPHLLGSDMIKKIWELKPDLPVILTTGYSDSINREQAEKLGINYLDKPINIAQLLETTNKLLSQAT